MPTRKKRSDPTVGVIDIFAGPGGLGEGFSSYRTPAGARPFRIAVSAEMEKSAHETLRLRAFHRLLCDQDGPSPVAYLRFLEQHVATPTAGPERFFSEGRYSDLWRRASEEALQLTLGTSDNDTLYTKIRCAKRNHDAMVLIGGPPCQAYSTVGRARNTNNRGFRMRGDHRHFLYREYLGILAEFKPDVFIMENVRGILSSTVGGRHMFTAIRSDLANPSFAVGKASDALSDEYVLLPVHVDVGELRVQELAENDPSRFIVKCERHGAPQARHRVIIMGVRQRLATSARETSGMRTTDLLPLLDALAGLPRLRSSISRQPSSEGSIWRRAVEAQRSLAVASSAGNWSVASFLRQLRFDGTLPVSSAAYQYPPSRSSGDFGESSQTPVLNHQSRGHMETDLGRYLFSAAFSAVEGRSPSSSDFPRALAPHHKNWDSGDFADRFRTQLPDRPSATITSHIAKDGHAFIHWDASQCRSLTVREAARSQTFPDDYLFLGNRTQQYVQVGNAVPPKVAQEIAAVVWRIMA